MSVDQGVSPISAGVDDQGLQKQHLLRIERSNCDARLRNFAPIRDRTRRGPRQAGTP